MNKFGIKFADVTKALKQIDKEGVPAANRSRVYNLDNDGKLYPPKYVVALARSYSTGKVSTKDFVSTEAKKALEDLGFKVNG